jgi:hypothetical protein
MFPRENWYAIAAAPTYEVLALRYGIFDGHLQFQNSMIPDDRAAPDLLDFYAFAIRGIGRTIVMDTDFNLASAKPPWPRVAAHASALIQAGIAGYPDIARVDPPPVPSPALPAYARRTFQKYGLFSEITPARLARYAIQTWYVPSGTNGTISKARAWMS